MSWLTRKLIKSDWQYPVDYEAYFEKKRVQKEMDVWYQSKLLEEQRQEREDIWNAYMQSRNVNK